MWEIILKSKGIDDCPHINKRLLSICSEDRFAIWVARNTKTGVEIPLHIYFPPNPENAKLLIFSIHGEKRNGHKYMRNLAEFIRNRNVIIVAPDFSEKYFPNSWAFTFGKMFTEKSLQNKLPKEDWAFSAIGDIFSLFKSDLPSLKQYSIFGHSAGGQFVHRLLLFTNDSRLDKAVAANAGWYTTLDTNINFPYGVKDLIAEEDIKKILTKKLIIITGEKDIYVDKNTRMTKRASKQGANRHARAFYVYNKALEMSKKLKCKIRWQLVPVKELDHSGKKSAKIALDYLL